MGRAYPAGGLRSERDRNVAPTIGHQFSYDWITSRRYLRLGVVA